MRACVCVCVYVCVFDLDGCVFQVRGENYRKSFQETGDKESSVWSCGQSMALIDDVPTCKQLVETIVSDAEQVMTKRLGSMIVSKL